MATFSLATGLRESNVTRLKWHQVCLDNNHAWRKALMRARIKDFRWHDLRHTWASWHVQSGTPLHELQQLGGWSNYETVLRYAHLSSEHLRMAAERIYDTKLPQ
jgi:integrase